MGRKTAVEAGKRQSVQPRSEGGSGSGATLRPSKTGVAGQRSTLATRNGAWITGESVSTATRAMHPAMARQPGVISLHGPEPLSDLFWPIAQSGMPAIGPAIARSCCISAHGLDANATPCPARPTMTPSSRRRRRKTFIRVPYAPTGLNVNSARGSQMLRRALSC